MVGPAWNLERCVFCESLFRDFLEKGAGDLARVRREETLVVLDRVLEEGLIVDTRFHGALLYRANGDLCRGCHIVFVGSDAEKLAYVERAQRRREMLLLQVQFKEKQMAKMLELVQGLPAWKPPT